MILPYEILQLDIPDMGRNHFFLVPVRKVISVQEIYSDSLFDVLKAFVVHGRRPCVKNWYNKTKNEH